jgi:glycosyltransferase involved in cell wall biosynthesis
MRHGKRIAVVIPAFEEERLIARVIRNLPAWVDRVVVVDDASGDGTSKAAREASDPRVVVLRHEANRGVGASIVTGYRAAMTDHADVIAVMAGDDQMDPSELGEVVEPVVSGQADYVKGNRFAHALKRNMPVERRIAGGALAALTRATTRLAITDSQCGYTAISSDAARTLPLHDLWPRYGYPNDMLALLAAAGLRVVEVPVRPVYADEVSGVKPWHAAVVAGVILRRWWSTRPGAPHVTE